MKACEQKTMVPNTYQKIIKCNRFCTLDCLKQLSTCYVASWNVLPLCWNPSGEPGSCVPSVAGVGGAVHPHSWNEADISSWPKSTVGFFQRQLHAACSQMNGSSWWGASKRRGIWKKRKRIAKVPPPAKQAAVESTVKCSSFGIVTLKKSNRKHSKS